MRNITTGATYSVSCAVAHKTDAADGSHGDLLDLIAVNRGLDFRAALEEASAFLSLPMPQIRQAGPPAERGSSEAARRLFAASKPVRGTLAESWFRQRGIVLPADVSALRFHPRCYYRGATGRETWPALIAAVTDTGGAITGVHRTWLHPDGGKAPVDQPRRALGALAGNAVRFGSASDVLTAAEGIETALALKMVMPAMPVAAALSSAHLAALVMPSSLRRLYVAVDNDAAGAIRAGKAAVQMCTDRDPPARAEDGGFQCRSSGPRPAPLTRMARRAACARRRRTPRVLRRRRGGVGRDRKKAGYIGGIPQDHGLPRFGRPRPRPFQKGYLPEARPGRNGCAVLH